MSILDSVISDFEKDMDQDYKFKLKYDEHFRKPYC